LESVRSFDLPGCTVESVPTEGAPGTTRTCLRRGKATLPAIAAARTYGAARGVASAD
jgi:hypothetical protein